MTLEELTEALRRLREPWPEAWPGLPVVFAACVSQLDSAWGTRRSKAVQALLQSGLGLAAAMEARGAQLAGLGQEPPYHSRLHTADALVALTALLLTQRRLDGCSGQAMSHAEALLLVTMLGHDALHDGRRNAHDGQLEQMAVAYVQPVLQANGVGARDRAAVGALIMLTDPKRVARQHALAQRRPFGMRVRVWQSVVIEEADILVSALPEFQEALTQQLVREWSQTDSAAAQALLSPGSRRRFLTQAARFSSPAAQALGLPALVASQLATL